MLLVGTEFVLKTFVNLQELKQSFNYGLFCPPVGTKCGKFLDEEKALNEYQFSDYVGYLEVNFEKRLLLYKMNKLKLKDAIKTLPTVTV